MRAALSTTIALALTAHGAAAFAQRSSDRASVRLFVERTDEAGDCADEARSRASLAARLGYDPVSESGAMRARLRWARAGRRFTVQITIERPGRARPAVRSLASRAHTCDALGDAMSLALAIAIDPVAAAEMAARPSAEPSSIGAARALVSSLVASDAPVFRRMHGVSLPSVSAVDSRFVALSPWWFASARVELSLPGALPTVDFGASSLTGQAAIGLGIRSALWSVRLDVLAALPARLGAAPDPIDLWNVGLSLYGCAHPRGWLSLCGASSATLTGASSANLQLVAASIAPGWALGARVAVEPRLGSSPVSLLVALDGLGWVASPALRVDERSVWSRPRFMGALSLGATLRFR